MKFLYFLASIPTRFTALFVCAAATLAFFSPTTFAWVEGNAQTATLGLIMLTMGMTLSTEDFKILMRRPYDILAGAVAQFTIMPLIAWSLVNFLDVPKGIAVGILIVGTCPGGVSSNIMSFLAKGDLAFSVGMTTVSTLLAPIATPTLMLLLAGETVDVNAWGMFKSILIVTLIPVCAGVFLNAAFSKRKFYKSAIKIMPTLAVFALACIVGGVTARHGDSFLKSGVIIVGLVAIHNALGYLGGYFTGVALGMKRAQKRTLSIEVGCQNAGLGTSLASTHFPALPEAAVASAVACVWHSVSGTVLANLFAFSDTLRKKKSASKK